MILSRRFVSLLSMTLLPFCLAGCDVENEFNEDSAVTVLQPGSSDLQEFETEALQDEDMESETATDDFSELGEEIETLANPSEVQEESSDLFEEESELLPEPSGVVFMPLSEKEDVVEFVEIDRYMGRWYEIATTPSFQQGACYGTTADYTFNDSMGWVNVTNSCYNGSLTGSLQKINGLAELDDTETQAKLLVSFFGQSSPYWVVALDGSGEGDQYAWAVVSVPFGQTMWLLSRTKQMDPIQRDAIEAHLIARGFPVDTLIDTPHVY